MGVGVKRDILVCERLLNDASIRSEMAVRGKSMIDGKGAMRLFDEIDGELFLEKSLNAMEQLLEVTRLHMLLRRSGRILTRVLIRQKG